FHDTAPTHIYTLSLHDALPICIVVDVVILTSNYGGFFEGKLKRSCQLTAFSRQLERIAPEDLTVTRGLGLGCALDQLSQELTYRSEEHTSELQSRENLVCRLLL